MYMYLHDVITYDVTYLKTAGQVLDAELQGDVGLAHKQRLVDLDVTTSGRCQRAHFRVDARHQISELGPHVRVIGVCKPDEDHVTSITTVIDHVIESSIVLTTCSSVYTHRVIRPYVLLVVLVMVIGPGSVYFTVAASVTRCALRHSATVQPTSAARVLSLPRTVGK